MADERRPNPAKTLFLGFAGMITAVAVWAVWGAGTPPEPEEPTGDPDKWTHEECRLWLRMRNLYPDIEATTEELRIRIKANMRIDRPQAV